MVLRGGDGDHDGILPKMETREPVLRRSLDGVRAAKGDFAYIRVCAALSP